MSLEYALIFIIYCTHVYLILHNIKDPDKTFGKSKETLPLSQLYVILYVIYEYMLYTKCITFKFLQYH